MTAVEWYYEQIVIQGKTNYWELLEQAKEMEKQQIIQSYRDCHGLGHIYGFDGEEYYNETYGSNESFAKGSEKQYLSQTNTFQTEISDEEIEEQSWGYREVTKDMEIPPNEDWSNGAKWYREQLKNKQ